MEISIRELEPADFDAGFIETLSALREVTKDRQLLTAIFSERNDGNTHTYVAVGPAGRIVGTIALIMERKYYHDGKRVGHIEDLAVHPSEQGHGIGTKLLEYAMVEAKKAGCYKLVLECTPELVDYYQRLGFKQNNIRLRYDSDDSHDS